MITAAALATRGQVPIGFGQVCLVIDAGNSSRQKAFIFETTNDVTRHLRYVVGRLSEAVDLVAHNVEDGPVLQIGAEVTVGG